MTAQTYSSALIVGAGAGLSASLARLMAHEGLQVSLAARDPKKLSDLCEETGAVAYGCDSSRRDDVESLFAALDADERAPDVVIYNPSYRTRGPLVELDPDEVERSLAITAFGAFLVAQQAARRMLAAGYGAILLTGASAGVKGYPQSTPFAMGKFALRGLAQSMARELQPKNIHVAHFVIDGGIFNPGRSEAADKPDSMLRPDAIARSYLDVLRQDRSAWAWELELRPWVENF
jgi:NAD(P)-dependent dehydrogenase (short-subunit alcohol dehydrogenase family)